MAKRVRKLASSVILGALEAPSGNLSSDSCGAGHKLEMSTETSKSDKY